MMANYSKSEGSVMKVKIGNIEPKEVIKVEFKMLGKLRSEIKNTWTLRIPSHIAPRYSTETRLLEKLFHKLLKNDEKVKEYYLTPKMEWSFNIVLNCSQKIVDWKSSSHELKFEKVDEKKFVFELEDKEYPEKDLEFTYERDQP